MQRPAFLLLDEPAAGMSAQEAAELSPDPPHRRGTWLRRLIEHNVGLVLGLCDHIVVLDSGAVIETGPAAIKASDEVRHAYMGTAAETDLPVTELATPEGGMSLLAVSNVSIRYGRLTAVRNVSFTMAESETCSSPGRTARANPRFCGRLPG